MASVINDAAYLEWLEDDAVRRAVIVEATYHDGVSEQVAYFSNVAFISTSSDTPADKDYDDILISAVEISKHIGRPTSVGELLLDNSDASRDDWLGYSWNGWPLKIYLGDPDWFRDDFRLIVNGTNAGIRSPSQNQLAFGVREKREGLRIPLQETLTDNNNELVPICLGECFNIEPVLIDGPNHIYQVHESAINSLPDVRDNGVTVAYTASLAGGAFHLNAAPVGRVTADATGPTSGTLPSIVHFLAGRAVSSTSAIKSVDINISSLSTFSNQALLGVFSRSQTIVSEVIDDAAHSLGSYIFFNRLGNLNITQLTLPGSTVVATLGPDDIELRGFTVVDIEPVASQIRMGYARNFTPQDRDGLAGSLNDETRDLYAREYSLVTAVNTDAILEHPLAQEPPFKETYIVNSSDAQTEVERIRDIRQAKRTIYKVRTFVRPFKFDLGEVISITHSKFGFFGGTHVTIIGITENPVKSRVDLEVWK